ncbi:MAG: trehalose-phosphatase [Pseudomonadota bacterium]
MILPAPPALSGRHALFLDFDGTLAPLQDDADAVRLTEDQAARLEALSALRDGALALISGRDLADLAARAPASVWRIGNHGLYALAPGEADRPEPAALPNGLRRTLQHVADAHEGARLEVKGPVGTIHYRACPAAGPMILDAVRAAAGSADGYRGKGGNHVAEAIPDGANKGSALERAMARPPFAGRVPVMVGDDTTDEDGFLAAQRLGGFGVKVGLGAVAGGTVARKCLDDVAAVWNWLDAGGGG